MSKPSQGAQFKKFRDRIMGFVPHKDEHNVQAVNQSNGRSVLNGVANRQIVPWTGRSDDEPETEGARHQGIGASLTPTCGNENPDESGPTSPGSLIRV